MGNLSLSAGRDDRDRFSLPDTELSYSFPPGADLKVAKNAFSLKFF